MGTTEICVRYAHIVATWVDYVSGTIGIVRVAQPRSSRWVLYESGTVRQDSRPEIYSYELRLSCSTVDRRSVCTLCGTG